MTSPTDHYDDLRAAVPGAALDALLADLHAAYAAPAPAPELRAAITRLGALPATERPRPRPIRGAGRTRSGVRLLAVAGVLAALIGTGAAIVVPNLVNQAISRLPGGVDNRYAVTLNQSWRACGFTITLKRAYADGNRLLIGYTVSTPPGRVFDGAYAPVIDATTVRGQRLAPLNSADTADMGLRGATNGVVQEFDTSVLPRGATLRLHLVVPTLTGAEIIKGRAPATPSCERDGPIGAVPLYKAIRSVTVPGPYIFDVAMPFSSRLRVAAPHLSKTSRYGTTITLERIRVTPTEARLYVRYVRGPRFFLPISIVAGGVTYGVATASPVGHGLWVARVFPPLHAASTAWLFDDHGAWTVHVMADYQTVHGSGSWRSDIAFTVYIL